MTKKLYLEDLKNLDEKQIKEHLIKEYTASEEDLAKYTILIAYESVGDYGCDSSSYFLMRDKKTKEFYEFSGGHCSCYGFEGQYEPQIATLKYLQSDKFHFYTGGYDNYSSSNEAQVKEFIKGLRK